MLYLGHEVTRQLSAPALATYDLTTKALRRLPPSIGRRRGVRHLEAATTVLAGMRLTHERPQFGIHSVTVGSRQLEVVQEEQPLSAFASLIHFRKATASPGAKVLVVGPLSGHFTTLIRPTIKTLLGDHDVHVLDWRSARDVPLEHGVFGLDDYIDHVMVALRQLGPDTHIVSVCQPAVPALAAVALLSAEDPDAQPASLTLIAGPVDTRVNPNKVNEAATTKSLAYFERRVITTVPRRYAGAGRRVYPGFVQLASFMSLSPKRHVSAHWDMYRHRIAGDLERAETTRAFYEEYGAVMDVHADFYLETVDRVFQRNLLALGELTWRGQRVDLSAISRTALLTVEGANDDMCSPGQTVAAHALCVGIDESKKEHHLQPGVGHYGVFSGSRWQNEIYPVVKRFIAANGSDPW